MWIRVPVWVSDKGVFETFPPNNHKKQHATFLGNTNALTPDVYLDLCSKRTTEAPIIIASLTSLLFFICINDASHRITSTFPHFLLSMSSVDRRSVTPSSLGLRIYLFNNRFLDKVWRRAREWIEEIEEKFYILQCMRLVIHIDFINLILKCIFLPN